jgi:hypothetical protein
MSVPPEQSDKLLTQADIDALLGKGASKKPAANSPPVAETPAPPVAEPVASKIIPNINVRTIKVPPLPGNPASSPPTGQTVPNVPKPLVVPNVDIKMLKDQMATLVDRLTRLEASVNQDNQNAEVATSVAKNEARSAHEQVNALAQQVATLKQALESTAGYNMAKTFRCTSCGTVGVVAIPVRCNKCGKTNWWGWWPRKK